MNKPKITITCDMCAKTCSDGYVYFIITGAGGDGWIEHDGFWNNLDYPQSAYFCKICERKMRKCFD